MTSDSSGPSLTNITAACPVSSSKTNSAELHSGSSWRSSDNRFANQCDRVQGSYSKRMHSCSGTAVRTPSAMEAKARSTAPQDEPHRVPHTMTAGKMPAVTEFARRHRKWREG